MLLFGILATVANAADFSVAQMPCARAEAPVLTVNTDNVPWPFKGHAARLIMESKAQADAHAEECTRLLTVASSTEAQDEHVGLALEVAVVNGQSVSFDGRKAVFVTGDAAIAHELPNGAFGYGGYGGGNVAGLVHARNLGFLQGQDEVAVVSGGGGAKSTSPKKTDAQKAADAELAKAKAAAKAAAEKKAREEAAKAASKAGS